MLQHTSILSVKKKLAEKKKSVRLPHIIPKIKRTHGVTEANAPYTLQQRTRVTDPGSVVYTDIATSPYGQ